MRHARESKPREREAVLISGLDLDGQAARSMVGGGHGMSGGEEKGRNDGGPSI